MKDHLIKLFGYDKYTNLKIIEAIIAAGSPQKPVELMAHLLTAEQVWLRRCQGEYQLSVILWPKWEAAELAGIANDTYEAWIKYLNGIDDIELQKTITYRNSAGNEFTMLMADIITHVINHGTHTRAQAGVHLRTAGAEKLPVTDYSFYINSVI